MDIKTMVMIELSKADPEVFVSQVVAGIKNEPGDHDTSNVDSILSGLEKDGYACSVNGDYGDTRWELSIQGAEYLTSIGIPTKSAGLMDGRVAMDAFLREHDRKIIEMYKKEREAGIV